MKRIIVTLITMFCTGCGLTLGKPSDPWLKLPDGVSFNVGVNNIDHVMDRKGLNIEKKDSTSRERY